MSDSLWPHEWQHARLSYPSPAPGACSNSCPSSRWCHPTISSSVVPFCSCLLSYLFFLFPRYINNIYLIYLDSYCIRWGVQFSCSVVSNYLQPHGLQYARLPCPSPAPGACSNSCPSCWWCYPTISSSVIPFSSCPQSFPASGSFLMSQFFTSGGQSIGASAIFTIEKIQ